ncbi:MAG: ADP-dependent NAD(P)H-hydrate dehydratase / NAD(P)H-hydrate epimerase [Actinomycetota bacterium]|nr:ADP-dependent NAD(P)H-hydrate dehydratase / NAD(P)H-hydrate epimerase [Actinomycetota bacterium]
MTPEEMAAADNAAIASGTPVEELMERAGCAVARTAIRMLEGRYGKKVVIVCGKGNNGGDGYVAERVLRREGVAARAFPVAEFDGSTQPDPDLVIDAIYGTGFRGAADDPAIGWIESCGAPVLSVDIPSGVDGLTGAVAGLAVRADVTVAMGAQKIGTAVGQGAVHAGLVEVVDIGIPVGSGAAHMTTRSDIVELLPTREADSHKRSRGSVAILGGSVGMSGAIILAANAAMRAGAGYVTAGLTASVQGIVAAASPEVLTRVLSTDEVLGAHSLKEFKPVLERATALAIGPGLGQGNDQRQLVEAALANVDLPVVLDADALNVLASDVQSLQLRTAPCVITPHPAELARLMGTSVEDIQSDRVKAVRAAAEQFGCTVILKGFRTVISDGHRLVVNPTGGPSLATAGTGDVLTGVVATFLGQGLGSLDAAIAATYVHGLAGEIAGEEGVIAGDVLEALPDAIDLVRGVAS